MDVQRRQALHRLQHVDGVCRPRLEETHVPVHTSGERENVSASPRRAAVKRRRGLPDADDVSVRLLLELSLDHPGAVFPVGHHPTAQ